jgi:hypothetical protein
MDPRQQLIDSALRAAQVIFDTTLAVCREEPLATVGEGQVKAAIARGLLEDGFSVLEGSAAGAKVLTLKDGTIRVQAAVLPEMAPAPGSSKRRLSPDVRVWAPVQLAIEVQCRSIWGSQDTLFSANILDDLTRICTGRAHLLVLAFDRPIYDSLRGLKADTRGRKALATDVFATLLPDSKSLGPTKAASNPSAGPYSVGLWAAVTSSPWGVDRVVVVALGHSQASRELA